MLRIDNLKRVYFFKVPASQWLGAAVVSRVTLQVVTMLYPVLHGWQVVTLVSGATPELLTLGLQWYTATTRLTLWWPRCWHWYTVVHCHCSGDLGWCHMCQSFTGAETRQQCDQVTGTRAGRCHVTTELALHWWPGVMSRGWHQVRTRLPSQAVSCVRSL